MKYFKFLVEENGAKWIEIVAGKNLKKAKANLSKELKSSGGKIIKVMQCLTK